MNKLGFLLPIIIVALFIASCTKEVELLDTDDNISGTTIRYTVMVVSGGSTSLKSSLGIENATVSLVMNDSIYSVLTDVHGMATFNNLASGIVVVSIDCEYFTTVNFIADLTLPPDSSIQLNNLLNVSTMVVIFPLSGNETATISGQLFAETDLTTPGFEVIPLGLKVISNPIASQFINYINHSGLGEIINIAYENIAVFAISDDEGKFLINVPASLSGMKISINADEFEQDVILPSGLMTSKVFSLKSDTLLVVSGMTYYRNYLYH